MWLDWLVFCDYGLCVCPLMPLRHLLSYLGFSYPERGVYLQGCSSKAQLLLITLDEWYLLTAAPPDLEHGVAPLGPPAPTQPLLLGRSLIVIMIMNTHYVLGTRLNSFCPLTHLTSSKILREILSVYSIHMSKHVQRDLSPKPLSRKTDSNLGLSDSQLRGLNP